MHECACEFKGHADLKGMGDVQFVQGQQGCAMTGSRLLTAATLVVMHAQADVHVEQMWGCSFLLIAIDVMKYLAAQG